MKGNHQRIFIDSENFNSLKGEKDTYISTSKDLKF